MILDTERIEEHKRAVRETDVYNKHEEDYSDNPSFKLYQPFKKLANIFEGVDMTLPSGHKKILP